MKNRRNKKKGNIFRSAYQQLFQIMASYKFSPKITNAYSACAHNLFVLTYNAYIIRQKRLESSWIGIWRNSFRWVRISAWQIFSLKCTWKINCIQHTDLSLILYTFSPFYIYIYIFFSLFFTLPIIFFCGYALMCITFAIF